MSLTAERSNTGVTRRTTRIAVAAALVAGVLTLPLSPPVSADPTLPLVVDPAVVVVTDGVVVPVSDPSVGVPFVNQGLQAEVVATVDVVVDPADFVAGSLVGDALTRLGLDLATLEANSSTIEANGGFLLSEGVTPCGGASIDVGASCSLLVEVTDPTWPAGVAVELRSGNGDLVGRTFVLWQPDGDRLAGAVPFGNLVQLGDGIPFAAGSTIGRTAELGEPGHAGSPAVRSWWGSLSFVDQGRLDLTVQALDGPYGQGIDSSTPIRASLYRVAGTAIPPTMAALEQLVPTASGVGPGGTLTLSSSITPGGTYVLAVDDLGVATDFAVSGSFGYGGVGWDPAPTDPLERRTLTLPADATPVAAFTVYNQTPTATIDPPFDFTLPALADFVWQDASDPAGGCIPTDGSTFPSPGPVAMSAAPGSVCVVRVAVSGAPLALGQSREESVTVTGSNGTPQPVTYVLRASNRGNGPGNDFFAEAEDLSGLAIPAYVAGEAGRPVNTVEVQGTTVSATREPFEYGTVVDTKGTPDIGDDTETAPPTGTVWYRYTAPPNGFTGRLGYRSSPGFFVTPLAVGPYSTQAPSARYDVLQFAPGNTWPPSGLSFVRMQPGHTVWFQVAAVSDSFNNTREPDGPFTLELYQAPNEQDSIDNAYDVSFGRPWSRPFNWGGDGDTSHLTPDRVGGPEDGWFTATFDQPGYWSFVARSQTAAAESSVRPLGLRLFRSPTTAPVTASADLGSPIAQASGAVRTSPYQLDRDGLPVSGWEVSLRNVPVQPGRYYWTFDEGADGPTFFSLSSTYESLPTATSTVTDCDGAPVADSGDAFAIGGLPFGVPALPTTSERVFGGSATAFNLSARLETGVGDRPGDTASTSCAPSASVEGQLRVDSELGTTAAVSVPVRVLGTARATEALRGAVGNTDLLAEAGVVATVTITDPDTNRPVFSYERRLDRTSSVTPGGATAGRGTTTTRLDGSPVPGVPDTDVDGTVTCAPAPEGTCTVTPDATEMNSPVSASVSLRPGVGYRYRLSLEASVTARSSDQVTATLTSALLDAGDSLHLALTAPAGTSLRCSSAGTYCQSRLPGDAPDTTPPDTTISAPPATNAADVTVALGADEGNVTYECRTGTNPFARCANPFVLPNAAEGTVTVEARATDSSNNVDPTAAAVAVVVDRTPPTATIQVPSDGATFEPAAVPTAAVGVCADPAPGSGVASSEVRVDGVPTDVLVASPGIHTVRLDCVDVAGNTSSVTHTYNVTDAGADTTPPETAIDSVTLSGRDVSVVVSGTDDGVGPLTFECAVTEQIGYVPGVVVWQPCGSPVSFTNLAEGYYLVLARGRDAAGNVDATPAIRAFTVDVSPPQVEIFSPVDGSTYLPGGVPQLFWSCTDLDIDSSLLSVTVNGASLVGLELPSSPGVYTVAVRCVDRAGLATTVTSTYTVPTPDTTPPVITITGIAPGGVVTTATPTVTITSDEPLANVICTLDTPTPGGGTLSNDVGCFTPGDTSDTFTFPDLPDGSVTLTVSGQDEAGNDTTVTLTFSVEVLPTASITAPADGATYGSSEVPTSVTYRCADNGVITTEEVQLVPQDGGPAALLVGRPPNTAGTHTIRVVCVDGLGEEATATATYTVVVPDTTPPETAIDAVTVTGRDVSVVVSATDDGAGPLTFECAAAPGYGAGSEVWQPCVSPATFTNLAEGVYVVSARARDAAGNVDATPAIRAFTVDVTPPQLVVSSPVDGATYLPGQVPQLSWVCTDLDIDASLLVVTVNGSPIVGVDLPQAPGVYTVAVRCVNGVGLATTVTSTYTVPTPDTTPPTITITGIAPGSTVTSTSEPSVTIASDEPLANVICTVDVVRDDNGSSSSNDFGCLPAPPTTGGGFTFPALPDGSVTLTVIGFDEAGNETTVILSFDVQVEPVVTITSPVDGASFFVGSVPPLAYTCTDNNGVVVAETLSVGPNGDPWPGAPPSAPGTWRINVDCLDAVGNGGTASVTYTVRERPRLSVDILREPLGNPVPSTTPMRFTVRVRNEGTQPVGRKTVRIVLPDPLFVTTAGVDLLTGTGMGSRVCTFSPGVPLSGGIEGQVITCVLVDELAPGATDDLVVLPELRGPDGTAVAVSASVSADGCVDARGGPVCGTASSLFSIGPPPDTTAPVITIAGIANGDVVTDATPSVTINSTEPLFATICNLETPTPQGGTSSNDVGCLTDGMSSETFDLPELPDGTVTLTVFGQDAAGNRAEATVTFSVEVLPTASISSPADGATYFSSEVPTSVSYVCSDNGVITNEEVQLVPPGGGAPVLLVGAPPRTAGTHTVRVVCVDGLGEEAVATATYTVLPEGIVSVRTRDVQDEAPVVGACYALRRQLFVAVTIQSCDAASGPNADGAADGVTRFSVPFAGTYSLVGETVPQSSPGGRFTAPTQSVPVVVDTQVDVDAWTYRCASTCLLVQPKLGDGSEPTFPLWPLGVPGDLVAPVPLVPPGATSPPPFPTAFVIPDLTPGVATDIPVVADDFGRTPIEVGRIRVTPTAGLNRLEPLTILPAHTVTVNLQNPDGTPNASGGVCLQLRPVSFASRPTVAQCSTPGQSRLVWRALPGEFVVEQENGQLPPPGLLAPVLPVNVFDTQRELQVSLDFRFAPGATVRVNAVNFQGNPITQLPAGAAPTCEIGLFLVTNGTIAAAPTATACFGGGSPPASAVFRVPPGTYVVTKTAQFALSPLSTGANFVTVGSGDDVTTDLVFFRPEVGAPAQPTAQPDTLTVRPGAAGTLNVLTNDTPSAPGEALSFDRISGPDKGFLRWGTNGSVTYTAFTDASGTDVVTYDAVDPWGNRSRSTLTVTIQPWAQLGLTVTATPTPVAVGGLFEYVVVVTNPSPTERARGIRLELVMPSGAGTTALTQQPPLSGCSFSPPIGNGPSGTPAVTVICSFAELAPSGVATYKVQARVLPGTAGTTLSAAATLSSSDCLDVDPVATGSQCLSPVMGGPAVTSTTLVPEVVQVSPAPGTPLRVGDLTRQRFRVTNTGTLTARNVTMVVTFPAELGMTNLAVSPPLSGCFFSPPLSPGGVGTSAVTVSCSVGAVAPGDVRDLEIEARVLDVPVAPAAPVLLDVGSSDCPDTSPRAGVQCATTAAGPGVDRVSLTPAVRVERVGGGTTFAVGDEVRVVGTIANTSAIPARTSTVRIVLPAELAMTALESQPPLSGCSFSPPLALTGTPSVTVSCSLASLAASTTATYTLRARVLAVPGSPFAVRLEAGSRDCRDQTVGDGQQVCATAVNATPVVPLATSSGNLTLQVRSLGGGSPVFGSIQSIAPSLLGVRPPAGVGFPYGAMSFSVFDVPVGGSVTVDITAPSAVGGYWKLANGTWSLYPGATPIPGTTTGLRLTLVDGGLGDADGVANGVIVDPGALGVPNVGPTAPDRTVSTPIDTPVTIDVLTGASDSDGGVPEVVDATDGTSGTVTATTSDVTYTPDPGTSGDDTFTVSIGDGQGSTTTVTVIVQVGRPGGPPAPPPVVPVGVADTYQATAGTTLDVPAPGVLTNDAGTDLTAQLVTGPSVGSLSLRADGSFTFVAPSTAPAGTVTFSYRPSGPSGIGSETTVTIDVAAATVSKYAPLVSTRRDRGSATPLTGALLSGSVAVFVPTAREIDRVEWFLDDSTMTGRPRQVERFAPYDFNGTALDGRALLYPTRLLADGPHTVTARVVRRDGRTEVVTSAFTVSNPRPATRVLSFSTSSRRSNPAPLDGASLTGPVAVFVPPESDIASVRFSVDGVLRSTERFAAYDLGTTNANGTARLVTFPPGAHVVTARIEFDDGFVDTLTAQFTVTRE